MEQEIQLNEHNKQEYPPMHTAEHILNQTMVRMFGCPRSKNAHIERKNTILTILRVSLASSGSLLKSTSDGTLSLVTKNDVTDKC